MATFNPDLKYSKSHEWVRMDGDVAVIGISDFAQDALGDLVFVNLPQVGDEVTAGEAFGDVESVKAVSDLMSPVTGTVCEINEELLDAPESLNNDPYGAWIIKVENVTDTEELLDAPESLNNDPYGAWIIKVENVTDTEELLDAAAYEAHCAAEA